MDSGSPLNVFDSVWIGAVGACLFVVAVVVTVGAGVSWIATIVGIVTGIAAGLIEWRRMRKKPPRGDRMSGIIRLVAPLVVLAIAYLIGATAGVFVTAMYAAWFGAIAVMRSH